MSYVRGKGIYLALPGLTVLIPEHMNVQAMANYVRDLREWFGAQ